MPRLRGGKILKCLRCHPARHMPAVFGGQVFDGARGHSIVDMQGLHFGQVFKCDWGINGPRLPGLSRGQVFGTTGRQCLWLVRGLCSGKVPGFTGQHFRFQLQRVRRGQVFRGAWGSIEFNVLELQCGDLLVGVCCWQCVHLQAVRSRNIQQCSRSNNMHHMRARQVRRNSGKRRRG